MTLVLVVDDEARYRDLYGKCLKDEGFEVVTASDGAEALRALGSLRPAVVVSDVRMPGLDGLSLLQSARRDHPDLPFLLVTAFPDVRAAVEALKLGAVDYLTKPVDLDELVTCVCEAAGIAPGAPASEVPPEALRDIVAESPAIRALLRDAYRVADSDATVLVTGESGAGKEVLASFLHANSPRRGRPLVAVNCAAIPTTLIASELFGHEKGAFTGATSRRVGRFRDAHGGTLMLDEVGEMPLEVQASLLRALETGRVTPVGSDREETVDFRLVAATNRDLEKEVREGRFRLDLYYRINVITLDVPPLRERPEDILALARRFLARGGGDKKRLSRAATAALLAHPWPGNVRELANAMERARLLCRTEVVLPEHLPPAIRAAAPAEEPALVEASVPAGMGHMETLEAAEIAHVRRALEQTGGNRTRAAELLGITRRGLIYKLKRFGL